MARKTETLEEGLERSANKRGLTGAERHRYIGGTLHNLGKSKPRRAGDSKKPRATRARTAAPARARTAAPARARTAAPAARKPYQKPTVTRAAAAAPKRAAYAAPTVRKRERLELTVKENKAAEAGKPYKVYSIYRGKDPYKGGGLFRTPAAARKEAKREMDAYNDIRGVHVRNKLT